MKSSDRPRDSHPSEQQKEVELFQSRLTSLKLGAFAIALTLWYGSGILVFLGIAASPSRSVLVMPAGDAYVTRTVWGWVVFLATEMEYLVLIHMVTGAIVGILAAFFTQRAVRYLKEVQSH